jgi:hypothetical protein
MSHVHGARDRIADEVTSWPGVSAGVGRRGEFAFRVNAREIGHLHGDHAAHFFFPKDLWLELRHEGRIVDHPIFPGRQGPAARRIEDEADLREVIELLRLNYDHVAERAGTPQAVAVAAGVSGASS